MHKHPINERFHLPDGMQIEKSLSALMGQNPGELDRAADMLLQGAANASVSKQVPSNASSGVRNDMQRRRPNMGPAGFDAVNLDRIERAKAAEASDPLKMYKLALENEIVKFAIREKQGNGLVIRAGQEAQRMPLTELRSVYNSLLNEGYIGQ